jgi:Cu2+-exporting ATPase
VSATVACAGCQAAPSDATEPGGSPQAMTLYLPDIHCALCISKAERALSGAPGVRSARVNLTQKRALIEAAPWVEPRDLAAVLDEVGIAAVEFDAGVAPGSDPAERAMLLRLGVAGFAMMNVMLLSVAVWSGATDATRDLFHWIAGLIAVPAALFAAQPFFRSARQALAARRLNMDVPISLAILLALGLSVYETSRSGEHAYFDAALSLTFFLLVGRYLDLQVRGKARSAASELAALEVPRAIRVDAGTRREVRAAELAAGDTILVPPGTRLAADGVVTDGQSEVDRSLLTGETAPVPVAPGTDLAAGEINLSGPLTLRVTAAGRNTRLARIADLVAAAENARSRYVTLADRAARIYAPVVHLLALAAFAGWVWATGDVRYAMNVAVATLIITCPCALGLAIPAVSAAASARLYRAGVLIKSGTALERLAEVDTAVFDKTGTLTEGRLRLREVPDDADLALAAGLAAGSTHPLARAVHAAAKTRGIAPAAVEDVRERPGDGIEGRWQGRRVRLGRPGWIGAAEAERTATCLDRGDGDPLLLTFDDVPRQGAAEAVAGLGGLGLPVALVSGDAPAAARALADAVGIDEVHAPERPEAKAARVRELGAAGRHVLMVGDGLNDTAALAAAHASIAPATALDAARVVSDVVLTGPSLAPVASIVATARSARARMRENLGIAATYNAIAIPLAVAGYASPIMAALAMSTSSICVSLNALRLR